MTAVGDWAHPQQTRSPTHQSGFLTSVRHPRRRLLSHDSAKAGYPLPSETRLLPTTIPFGRIKSTTTIPQKYAKNLNPQLAAVALRNAQRAPWYYRKADGSALCVLVHKQPSAVRPHWLFRRTFAFGWKQRATHLVQRSRPACATFADDANERLRTALSLRPYNGGSQRP